MDYYFDSRAGDNANSGSSPDQAWRDFRRINGTSLSPGDRLLLKRGSHFRQQLCVTALGDKDHWIEITSYGKGARPVVENRGGPVPAEISHTGSLDEAAPCIYIAEAAWLRVSYLTVYGGRYGLLINNCAGNRSHIVVEDVIACNIHNGGLEHPRINSFGIGVEVGRGCDTSDVTVSDVVIRNCECFRTGTGFSTKAFGPNCRLENVRVEKVSSHHHANTPWSYVGLFMRGVCNGVYEGICLDGCAPHWKPTGTATVHHVRSDHIVFRNSYVANTQDTDSHDMGGWDFESGGHDCLIENCTFENNAGPAIEYLKRPEETPTEVEVRDCTFIHNDYTLWGGGNVLHVGRSGPDPTGSVHDNHIVLAPGTRFGGEGLFTMQNNREYVSREDLPPFVAPPSVDAGRDRTLTALSASLSGQVSNASRWRWETVIAPGDVVFDDPTALETTAHFSEPGEYLLRLHAENEHMTRGDYVTVRCIRNAIEDLIDAASDAPALGDRFTVSSRLAGEALPPGKHLLFTNSPPDGPLDGFRVSLDNRDPRGAALIIDTGNGEDVDAAYTDFGAPGPGTSHRLDITMDCTCRDGRGEANIYVDGRDVTLFGGVQSDLRKDGILRAGATCPLPVREAAAAPPPPFPTPEGFRLVFEEDFSGQLDANWRVLSGEWHIEDGCLATDGKGEILCSHRYPGDMLLVYDTRTDIPEPSDLSAALNALPESGTMHGYFFGFGTDFNTCSRLLRRTGPVAEYDALITPGRTHRVACMRAGRTLVHFVDDREVCSWEDPRPLSSGRQPYFTLYAHTGGRFESVRVYTRPHDVPADVFQREVFGLRIRRRLLTASEVAWEVSRDLES